MEYQILTYNLGHGRYSKNYVKGDLVSKEDIIDNIIGSRALIEDVKADINLLQETGVTKVKHQNVNHKKMLSIDSYDNYYLTNRYIPGVINIGNSVLINKQIKVKFEKLACKEKLTGYTQNLLCQNKRCIKILLDNLIVYNVHLCPYQKNRYVRDKQLINILRDAEKEKANGYAIVIGGDFNMLLKEKIAYLPLSFKLIIPSDDTCRNLHKSFKEHDTFLLDGFIISDDVKVKKIKCLENFEYSDHSPVLLTIEI